MHFNEFKLNSIDLAHTAQGPFSDFLITGTKKDLTTVTQTFSGTDTLQTYYLEGFNNLINIQIGKDRITNQSFTNITFDNLNISKGEESVSTVPVPAAAWLFGSAALGFFGLRRKNQV